MVNSLFIILSLPFYCVAFQPCPLLGPSFPPPTNLSSSPILQAALANLSSLLNNAINTGNTTHGPFLADDLSLSLLLFSTHSKAPIFQYSHTAPSLSNSTIGVSRVDENSIFRIGSISKLFTIYTFLVERGMRDWREPVTKYVTELANAAQNTTDWHDITIEDLASHMAGIRQSCKSEPYTNWK